MPGGRGAMASHRSELAWPRWHPIHQPAFKWGPTTVRNFCELWIRNIKRSHARQTGQRYIKQNTAPLQVICCLQTLLPIINCKESGFVCWSGSQTWCPDIRIHINAVWFTSADDIKLISVTFQDQTSEYDSALFHCIAAVYGFSIFDCFLAPDAQYKR